MPRPPIHRVRPVLGCLVAALLALTSVMPGPATAQQQTGIDPRLSQIIGALLIAGGIAEVIDERDDRKKARRAEEARREAERKAAKSVKVHRDFRPAIEPGGHRGGRARTLPASCLRDVTGGRAVKRVVGQQCLQRNGVQASLPVDCATLVEVGGRFRTAYTASCLQGAGFRFR